MDEYQKKIIGPFFKTTQGFHISGTQKAFE